jgi:hypothetical protein
MNWLPAGAFLVTFSALALFAACLTVAVLWEHAWIKFWDHLGGTARLYFRRIKFFGHTIPSTWTAVACSLVVWLTIVLTFTLALSWQACVSLLVGVCVVFLCFGYRLGGPRAKNHKFRFASSFFEPALALAVPSLAGKLVEAGLRSIAVALGLA